MPMPTPTLLAQLSDLHIRAEGELAFGRVDTAALLRQAIDRLLALPQRPDAVLCTGDLVDSGSAAEYTHLARLLAPLPMPVYLMPGNHDARAGLRAAFPDHAYLGTDSFIQYAVQLPGLRVLALDSVVPGSPAGRLCQDRLAWLATELAAWPRQPTLVALHHPPFATLIEGMDQMGLVDGAAELAALIAQHPQVERVLCGHLHRSIQARFGGTLALTAPSTCHQLWLDLGPGRKPAWTLEPPGFLLHAVRAEGGALVTHLVASGAVDGPHAFTD